MQNKIIKIFILLLLGAGGVSFANDAVDNIILNDPNTQELINDNFRRYADRIRLLEDGIPLSTGVTGILSITNGGTGKNWSGIAANSIPYFSSLGVMDTIGIGTTGYVLTAGSPPNWVSPSSILIYSSPGSGTFNVPSSTSYVFVTLTAAGGGGTGGAQSAHNASGGGAGETIHRRLYAVTPGGTVSYTVATGGTAGSGNEGLGTNGGDTIFGTLTANHGVRGTTVGGGAGGASGGAANFNATTVTTGKNRVTSITDFAGGTGGASANNADGGAGGASYYADGGAGGTAAASTNGFSGSFGSGGGAGSSGGGTSCPGGYCNGGAGGDGLIIVEY